MVAKQAGISRTALYRRWNSKEDLYLDVLVKINLPLPELPGRSAYEDVTIVLARLIERASDQRAGQMFRALNAEAAAFPELRRRYYEDVVSPDREIMYEALRRGVATGEIRGDLNVSLVSELLVSPVIARLSRGDLANADPRASAEEIASAVFAGVTPR